MRVYKFITIRQERGELCHKKPVYRVFNNKSDDQLAILSYYPTWRQYVFSTQEGVVFNNSCLRDILDFMEKHAGKE